MVGCMSKTGILARIISWGGNRGLVRTRWDRGRAGPSSASARSSGVSMSIESAGSVTRPATRRPIITRCSRMTSRRVTSTTPFCQ